MEMGVVNVRTDLFPWYEKQGYEIIGDVKNDSSFSELVADGLDVYCILMRKTLL